MHRYLNRELSWLAFNERVLEEAFDVDNPLLERLNFLAISASNLDEFTMVRVAGIKDLVSRGLNPLSLDGLNPQEELAIIRDRVAAIIARQNKAWSEVQELLAKEHIALVTPASLKGKQAVWLSRYFLENIFPVLTPIAIDPAHPFPYLPNLGMALLFELTMHAKSDTAEQIAIVPLPPALPRFVLVPGKQLRFVALEEMIPFYLDMLFPNFRLLNKALFRIIRDSDLDIEDEAEDFVRHFEKAVKQRRRGRVIRARFASPCAPHLMRFVAQQLGIEPEEVYETEGLLGMRALKEIYDQSPPRLKFEAFKVRFPERINDFGGDCFAAIAAKDIVVHHPFESFDVVVQFLRQAASDPQVVSIKQTLYRTSHDSPIVRALIEAAEAGKAVTALVELKARFDEEANLRFARDMERVGVQVVYGFVSLKTHAKVSLVTRREGKRLRSYVHFGTGNYHPNTARVYTDLSFFTTDPDLCRDAAYLFNFITGYAAPRQFKKLLVAPRNLRRELLALIDTEIEHAKAGRPAAIWAKMNALVDAPVIDALYAASQAGVLVELVVRGICCLRPGVPGLSENIRVKSLVGRFLEHARIYCFGNGHGLPSAQAKVYIGSADWMTRNLDWRVEVMIPIENPTVHEQVLSQIMVANMKDAQNSWAMNPDGSYTHIPFDTTSLSAHHYFMQNPSLSGRGSGLKKADSKQMLRAVGQKEK